VASVSWVSDVGDVTRDVEFVSDVGDAREKEVVWVLEVGDAREKTGVWWDAAESRVSGEEMKRESESPPSESSELASSSSFSSVALGCGSSL
jgi:hypothetical protein